MFFELYGRTLELSVEQVLRLTDVDFQYLVATQQGESINDPMHGSALRQLCVSGPDAAPTLVMDLLLSEHLDLDNDEVELAETLDVYAEVDFDFFQD